MTIQSGRCPACGGDPHDDAPCPPLSVPAIEMLVSGPCNCLPEPEPDWVECAHCGLPQLPGKAFCGYCGHRWRTADPG